jgi:hypothetical protein
MKRLYWMPVLALSMLLGACASTVKPSYVSPTQYQALNCQQLQAEYNRIQQYIDNGVQTPKRTGLVSVLDLVVVGQEAVVGEFRQQSH